MPTFTINITDVKARVLTELATARGLESVEALLMEMAEEVATDAEMIRKAPSEVLDEVRRRQETPLSGCRPAVEVLDELIAKFDRIAEVEQAKSRRETA